MSMKKSVTRPKDTKFSLKFRVSENVLEKVTPL